MKHLSELVQLLGSDFRLCTCDTQAGKATQKLFNYLRKHDSPNDTEAAALLNFQDNPAAYRKIKHLLKLELLNAVSGIRPKDKTEDERQRTFAYVWKLIAIAKQLRTSTNSQVLLKFLEEAFDKARKNEMLDAAFQCASMLRRQYNNRRFDPDRYAYYRDHAVVYRELSRDYQDVLADLNEIVFLRNDRADPDKISSLAHDYYIKNKELIKKHDVAIISYIIYLTRVNAYLAEGKYQEVIEVCNTALLYLNTKDSAQRTMFQVFEANLAVAYTQLNDYETGIMFARQLLDQTDNTDPNYLKVYELMLILTLRFGSFQEAYNIYREISPKTLTSDIRSYYHETFRIIEAYLHMLWKLGCITPVDDDNTLKRFRVKRFVNSFADTPSEKSYRNVHLLIVQIVNDIIGKRHNKSAYSIEAISKYAQRHLKGRGHERVRNFLKALAQLSVQRFHRSAVERHTVKYISALSKYKIADSNHDYYMELIPFELLWQLILEQLGHRRLRIRKILPPK